MRTGWASAWGEKSGITPQRSIPRWGNYLLEPCSYRSSLITHSRKASRSSISFGETSPISDGLRSRPTRLGGSWPGSGKRLRAGKLSCISGCGRFSTGNAGLRSWGFLTLLTAKSEGPNRAGRHPPRVVFHAHGYERAGKPGSEWFAGISKRVLETVPQCGVRQGRWRGNLYRPLPKACGPPEAGLVICSSPACENDCRNSARAQQRSS